MNLPKSRNHGLLRTVLILGGLTPSAHADIAVALTCLDGSVVRGTWSGTETPGTIAVRTPRRRVEFVTEDLLAVHVVDPFPPAERPDWQVTVWTTNGSRFPADFLESDGGAVVVKTSFAPQVRLPLDQLSALRWNRHAAAGEHIDRLLAEPDRVQDTLLGIHEGTIRLLSGTVDQLGSDGGVFTYRGRTLRFTPDNTGGIVFAAIQRRDPAALRCLLTNDDRIAGSLLATTDDTLTLRGVADLPITLALPTISALTFSSDRVVFLSELEPSDVEHHNLMDVPWTVRRDRSVTNQPMTLERQVYARGIGVHANTSVSYRLDTPFRSLAATIGIDDAVRPAGSVVFLVVGDGVELFRSDPVTGRDPPQDILVPLEDVRTLTLAVDSADLLDLGDHADWANVRLIKPDRTAPRLPPPASSD